MIEIFLISTGNTKTHWWLRNENALLVALTLLLRDAALHGKLLIVTAFVRPPAVAVRVDHDRHRSALLSRVKLDSGTVSRGYER